MSSVWFERRNFFAWLAGILAVELLSWLTYVYPQTRAGITVAVLVIALVASCYHLRFGVYLVISELVIGSYGYILALPLPQFTLSFRLGLFFIIIIALLIDIIRQRRIFFFESFFWKWYIALVVFVGLGALLGLFNGNQLSDVFFDTNGYLFLAMVIPFTQSIRTPKHLYTMLTILTAGVVILALQTIIVVFVFSHQLFFQYYLTDIYRWLRDFRLAEITRQENGFYRIFFQSHIYVLLMFLFSLLSLLRRWQWSFVILTVTSLMLLWLSYSRSFWVATVVLILGVWLYARFVEQVTWKQIAISAATVFASALLSYGFILGLVNAPIGGDWGSRVAAASLLTERTENPFEEAAGGSRIALMLPLLKRNLQDPFLGGGMGTTVTYATQDPRALETNPSGLYTTYAFEWGYLDLWLKLGLAGTVVYGILIGLLVACSLGIKKRLGTSLDQTIAIFTGFGVLALAIIHALTPYLNHPLGIGFLLLATVITDTYARAR